MVSIVPVEFNIDTTYNDISLSNTVFSKKITLPVANPVTGISIGAVLPFPDECEITQGYECYIEEEEETPVPISNCCTRCCKELPKMLCWICAAGSCCFIIYLVCPCSNSGPILCYIH
jgi:hypothetical protein